MRRIIGFFLSVGARLACNGAASPGSLPARHRTWLSGGYHRLIKETGSRFLIGTATETAVKVPGIW